MAQWIGQLSSDQSYLQGLHFALTAQTQGAIKSLSYKFIPCLDHLFFNSRKFDKNVKIFNLLFIG